MDITDSANIVDHLVRVWKRFKLKDFIELDVDHRAGTYLSVYRPTITELVREFRRHNQYIAIEADRSIENYLARQENERHQVVLDLYLADKQQMPIEVLPNLRRIQGLIMEHRFLLQRYDNQYYQRQSVTFYHDLVELTHALVAMPRPGQPQQRHLSLVA